MNSKGIVIAKYNEGIEWIADTALSDYDIYVYNKGKGKRGFKLPNIGREAHTYLYHIINNYDILNEVMVFAQGNPFDHCPNFMNKLNKVSFMKYYDFDCLHTLNTIRADGIYRQGVKVFSMIESEFVAEILKQTNKQFKTQKLSDGSTETIFNVSHYAIFSVPRAIIHKYPRSFYEKLYEHTETHEYGAYALEVLWRVIFE